MNRRSFLALSLAAPIVAAVSRFPGLVGGTHTPSLPETRTVLLYPGADSVFNKYDIIELEGRGAWVVGVSGDTITVIRGAFPPAPLSA